ncbi:MAG: WecB/TagA/CpsF family glycosyltransferase, partial [Pseudomonadota bacterium]
SDVSPKIGHHAYDRDVIGLLGIPLDVISLEEAAHSLTQVKPSSLPYWVSTVNLNWLVMAEDDHDFRANILRSDLVTCDGAPLVKLAHLMGVSLPGRVTGADLFETLRERNDISLKTYFFGGRGNSAENATDALEQDHGGLLPVGGVNPGFGDLQALSAKSFIDEINGKAPDLLIIALGAHKGQAWINANRHQLKARIVSHWGAVVDFAAGDVARAPKWVQRLHAEWLWRIGQDPALWKRYFEDGLKLPLFIKRARTVRKALTALGQKPRHPLHITENAGHIILEGDLPEDDLSPLRQALISAESQNTPLTITLGQNAHLGLKAIGLLLIAHGRWMDRNLRYEIITADTNLRMLLHVNRLPVSSAQSQPPLDPPSGPKGNRHSEVSA